MGGGPSTPALAAAVAEAGGLGFLAAGYKTVEAVRADVEALRALTDRPFGVNLFAPPSPAGDVSAFAVELVAEAEHYGAPVGEPRHDDDAWEAKLALMAELEVPVVSFSFGCPARDVHARFAESWVTVTTPAEAREAAAAGADRARRPGRRGGRPSRRLRRRGTGRDRPAGAAPAHRRRPAADRHGRDRRRARHRRGPCGRSLRRPARDRVHALPRGGHRARPPRRHRDSRRDRADPRVHRPRGARHRPTAGCASTARPHQAPIPTSIT